MAAAKVAMDLIEVVRWRVGLLYLLRRRVLDVVGLIGSAIYELILEVEWDNEFVV